MKKASIRLPAEPTTKNVWIGSYGGHFDVEYIYIVKANGDIVVRRPMDGFWDNAYLSFTTVYRIVI